MPLDWDDDEVITRDRRWPRGTGLDRVARRSPRIEIFGLDAPDEPRSRRALPLPRVVTERERYERSEERRVGKECRCRWSPYDYTKKDMQDRRVAPSTSRHSAYGSAFVC